MNYFKAIKPGKIIIMFTAVLAISSCLKKEDNIEPTPLGIAYLINAAPKSDSANFYINNNIVNNLRPLKFTEKTQTLGLPEGSYLFSLSKSTDTVKYVKQSFSFLRDKFYTIFVIPTATSVELIQREEFTSLPTPGKMKIRFANFLYGSPKLNLHIKNVGNAFQDIEFKTVSSFIELNPNGINFQLKNTSDTTQIKIEQTMGAFEVGKSYTIIAGGDWNATTGIASPVLWKVIY